MEKTMSIRPNVKIMSLYAQIMELDRNPETTRSAIFGRALEEAVRPHIDWIVIADMEVGEDVEETSVPESLQVKADEEKLTTVINGIRDSFNIKRVKSVYLIRLVLSNYLVVVRKKRSEVGSIKVVESVKNKDISGPEMVKILTEMILLNMKSDEETIESIKKQLIEWRDN